MNTIATRLLTWILFQITMCFTFWDGDKGSGGSGGTVVAPPPKDKKKPEDIKELTMEDLTGIMKEVAKTSTKEELETFKQKSLESDRKAVFPFQDGKFGDGEVESVNKGSIIDTSFFSKAYGHRGVQPSGLKHSGLHPSLPAGMVMGTELTQIGGPFKRLSPTMENFAKIIKFKGNIQNAVTNGLDVHKHNNSIKTHYKQAGMNEGTVSAGGALVPIEFVSTVIEFATAQSQIISKVWRLPMSSLTLRIPRLVQAAGTYFGGITLYSPDEGQRKQSSYPELERLELEAKKLIGLIYLTDELIADSPLNIVNYVTGLFVRAFQYDIEQRILAAAAGAGPCLGIINDPVVVAGAVARQTAGTIGFQDIINMDNNLDENFTDLTWICRKVSQNTLAGLRDVNNRPIYFVEWEAFKGSDNLHPASMYGYPAIRTRNVPLMGTQGDLILGDLSWYLLGIRQDMTIDQSEHVRFIYDEQTLRFVMRLDGMPAVPIAFSILGDVLS